MSLYQVLMTLTLSHELRFALTQLFGNARMMQRWRSSKHLVIGGSLGRGWSVHVAIHVIATALAPGARAVTSSSTLSARHVILRRYQSLHTVWLDEENDFTLNITLCGMPL